VDRLTLFTCAKDAAMAPNDDRVIETMKLQRFNGKVWEFI
jgi:hypothetical protein